MKSGRRLGIKACLIGIVTLLCFLMMSGTVESANRYHNDVVAYASEENGVEEFVSRLYTVILGREADEAGLAEWTGYLLDGTFTGVEVAEGFIMSDEFLGVYRTNEEFVTILYNAFFGRTPDEAGLVAWVEFMDSGYNTTFIFAGFANSDEFGALCESYGVEQGHKKLTVTDQQPIIGAVDYKVWLFVERLYTEVLERTPDLGGLQSWVNHLLLGTYTGVEVASGFILSDEFQAKDLTNEEYVQIMYRAFFGRGADPLGLEGWVKALENGYTKEDIFRGFAYSDEFAVLCENYGITHKKDLPVPGKLYEIVNVPEGVRISWNAVEGVAQYGVWRSATGENGTYEWFGNVAELSFTDTLVDSGRTYYYKITSYDAEIQIHSEMSEVAGITYLDTPVITNIYNVAEGVTMEWDAVEGAEAYAVYRRNGNEKVLVDHVEGTGHIIWTDEDIADKSSYPCFYSIQAVAGNELQIQSGSTEEGGRIIRLQIESTLYAISSGLDLSNKKYSGYIIWNSITLADGYEVCILQDSVEILRQSKYETLKDDYGQILSHYCSFSNLQLETLGENITFQIRTYRNWPDGERCYSAWTEEERVVLLPEIRDMLREVASDISKTAETDLEKLVAAYEWLIYNAEYKFAEYRNQVLCDHCEVNGYALLDSQFVCFDFLAKELGVETELGAVLVPDEEWPTYHNLVKLDDTWYRVDAAMGRYKLNEDKEGLERYIQIYETFLVSDDEILELYPEGTAMFDYGRCNENYDIFNYIIERDGAENSLFAGSEEELRRDVTEKYKEGYQVLDVWYFDREIPLIFDVGPSLRALDDISNDIYCIFDVHSLSFTFSHTELAICSYRLGTNGMEMIIPEGTSSIGETSFYDMEDMVSVDIPGSVQKIGVSAFNGCSSLAGVEIPEGVTSIELSTFEKCTSLLTVELPDSVVTIGEGAFRNCSSLSEIDIPDSVTNIGEYAFAGCTNLERVHLSENLTVIPFGAFQECNSLQEINIPVGIKEIGYSAFEYCSSLVSVELPEGLALLDNFAFSGCSSLQTINIPVTISKLNYGIFSSCSKLTSIEIPEGITEIEEIAFSGCNRLTDIRIPDSVISIGERAFTYCNSLTSIEIPDSVTSLGKNMFGECSKLIKVTLPDNITNIGEAMFKNCGSLESIDIPDSVTCIEPNAFYNCKKLRSIIIPDGVTVIGANAFYNCIGLKSIRIPDSVTEIGENAFYNCTGFTSWKIPDGTTSIEDGAFYGWSSLTSIEIPDSVTSIGARAFYNCTALTSVKIPDSVTDIGAYAFYNCSALTAVEMADSVTNIGELAFSNCNSLTEINLSKNVTCINDSVFSGCRSLKNIELPNRVTHIGDNVFGGCTGLTEIHLPNTVTTLGNDIFKGCTDLTTIEIPEGVTAIGAWSFADCTNLAEVKLPESIEKIGNYAFYGCESLTEIELPDNLTSLGESAFYYCGFTNIALPDGLKEISSGAFQRCESLEEILIPDSVTSIGSTAFSECRSLTEIELPNSVTSIGAFAFFNSALSAIRLPESLTTIGNSAFANCKSLTEIEIPDSVTTLGDSVFKSSSLSEITLSDNISAIGKNTFAYSRLLQIEIPEGVTSIEESAFEGCKNLCIIKLPDSLISIGKRAFYNCSSLKNIELPDDITSVGESAFEGCTGLESVKLPAGLTNSGSRIFRLCSKLKNVTIPNGVTAIGDFTFDSCSSLEKLEIPDSVTTIGYWVFYSCAGLKDITIPDSVTSIGLNAFVNCNNLTIHCPAGSYAESFAITNNIPYITE